MQRVVRALQRELAQPIDVASLALFRIVFGLCCTGLCIGFLTTGFLTGWVGSCAVELHWEGLEWLALPCDLQQLRVLVALTGLAALGVTVGAHFRVSAWTLFALMAYALAADQAIYSSTYYLMVLMGFWLACSPADRAWSIDARRHGGPPEGPAWPLRMLQFHVAVMYVYAAIAKLDADWLAGRPVGVWMRWKKDLPLIGPSLQGDAVALVISRGGLLFDALVVPGLLWRRTRALTLVVMFAFHAFNGVVLEVFPLPVVAAVGSLLLLPPDWPRRRWGRGRARAGESEAPPSSSPRALSGLATAALGAYVAVHLLIPLRHHLYPGPVAWNEDGDEFAWRLRARTKKRRLAFTVIDVETGTQHKVPFHGLVTGKRAKAVLTYPDRILQVAHHIADGYREVGREVEVHVRYRVGLNGRPLRDLIDPKRDLAAQPRTFLNSAWIESGP